MNSKIEGLFEVALKLFVRHGDKLLILTASNTQSGDFPGGRLAPTDSVFDLKAALRREIKEELGDQISLKIYQEPLFYFPYTSKAGTQEVLGLALAGEYLEGNIHLSEEHFKYEWLSPKEALTRFEGDFRNALERYIESLPFQLSGTYHVVL